MNIDDFFVENLLKNAQVAAQTPARPEPDGEYAIAQILLDELRGRLRYAEHRNCWMAYDGGIWQPITEQSAAEMAVQGAEAALLREIQAAATPKDKSRYSSLLKSIYRRSTIANALYFLAGQDGIKTKAREWDADPWLVACINGVINLRDCSLIPHSPDYLLTKRLEAEYNPDATAPKWEAHLAYFLPDPEIRRHVQRTLGMALVGTTLDEHLEIWWGGGGNGKSTTSNVILGLFGELGAMAAPDLLMVTKHEQHPTRIADLAGRRIIFSKETEEGKRLNEALAKELTGGDRKKGRFMRGDFFEFEQTFDVFLFTNKMPVIRGQDYGIWRRIRLVPWTVIIEPNKRRDQNEVVTELLTERSGILNWLLAGLRDWQQDHWWVAPAVQAATEDYRSKSDRLGAFLADCCEFGQFYTVDKGLLYAEYVDWCTNNGEDPIGKKTFGDLLRDRGIGEVRQNKSRKWLGIRLIP